MTNAQTSPASTRPKRGFFGAIWHFIVECMKYIILIGLGGALAILASYLMRQFGY